METCYHILGRCLDIRSEKGVLNYESTKRSNVLNWTIIMYIEKKTIEQYRDKNRLTSPRHITPYMNQNEYFNTFCEEEAASVITIENQWTIEQHQSFIVTKSSQDVLSRFYTLQSHFHVNDYNRVNDYHLIINEIKIHTIIYFDEQMVTYIVSEDSYHRIHVQTFVHEGHNNIILFYIQ
ncbi:hypothetical protein BUY80_17065 [Staphylococcus equorum]|nr:hypothetical protein BUY80_17065 [Staphylococcus equorum]